MHARDTEIFLGGYVRFRAVVGSIFFAVGGGWEVGLAFVVQGPFQGFVRVLYGA